MFPFKFTFQHTASDSVYLSFRPRVVGLYNILIRDWGTMFRGCWPKDVEQPSIAGLKRCPHWRLSPISATIVDVFGDKLSPNSANVIASVDRALGKRISTIV